MFQATLEFTHIFFDGSTLRVQVDLHDPECVSLLTSGPPQTEAHLEEQGRFIVECVMPEIMPRLTDGQLLSLVLDGVQLLKAGTCPASPDSPR